MKNIIFKAVLLFMAFSNSLWSAEVDTVWVSDYGNIIQFQHPVTKDLIFVELSFDIGKLITMDSKNGKIIKEVPFKNDWNNKSYISPNGTKLLHTNRDETFIYEYPNMQLFYKLDTCLFTKFINDNEIVYRRAGSLNIIKYNLITKESQKHTPEGSVKSIVTSLDGRFIAYSISSVGHQQNWSKLVLIDAKTMEDITIIDEVSNKGHNYGQFNFSKNGKFISYYFLDENKQFGLKIYNTETNKIERKIDLKELSGGTIKFLNNNLYIFIKHLLDDTYETQVIDMYTDKIIIKIKNIDDCLFNSELNHLYYTYDTKTICLNLTNVLTGIIPNQINTIVNYQNKILTIKKENIRHLEISDISGRIILNKINDSPISNNTILPINLANGAYLINITTDKENFTHKLMVME